MGRGVVGCATRVTRERATPPSRKGTAQSILQPPNRPGSGDPKSTRVRGPKLTRGGDTPLERQCGRPTRLTRHRVDPGRRHSNRPGSGRVRRRPGTTRIVVGWVGQRRSRRPGLRRGRGPAGAELEARGVTIANVENFVLSGNDLAWVEEHHGVIASTRLNAIAARPWKYEPSASLASVTRSRACAQHWEGFVHVVGSARASATVGPTAALSYGAVAPVAGDRHRSSEALVAAAVERTDRPRPVAKVINLDAPMAGMSRRAPEAARLVGGRASRRPSTSRAVAIAAASAIASLSIGGESHPV